MRTEIEKIHYTEIDSTSTEAGKLVRERGFIERPILVSADRQNAGRGRQGKSFLSPEGGIYFTFAIPDALISGDYDDSQKDKLVEDICLRLLTYGGSLAPYISEIRAKSCVIGRNITYFSSGVATDGKALDITNDGGLLVSSCGRQVVLSSGELSLRFDGDARL